MNKLIKMNKNHYIICDDSEIKKDDWNIELSTNQISNADFKKDILKSYIAKHFKKITHSTQPLESNNLYRRYEFIKIKPISLSEVEEVINGYSVEKMANLDANLVWNDETTLENEQRELQGHFIGYQEGFKAHQELVKDKLIVDNNQMMDIMDICVANKGLFRGEVLVKIKEYLQPKTEWNISIDENNKITLL